MGLSYDNDTTVEFMDADHLLYENDQLRKVIKEKDQVIRFLIKDIELIANTKGLSIEGIIKSRVEKFQTSGLR